MLFWKTIFSFFIHVSTSFILSLSLSLSFPVFFAFFVSYIYLSSSFKSSFSSSSEESLSFPLFFLFFLQQQRGYRFEIVQRINFLDFQRISNLSSNQYVLAMFTNIPCPCRFGPRNFGNQMGRDQEVCTTTKELFFKSLKFCLNNSYLTFNNKGYSQTSGL